MTKNCNWIGIGINLTQSDNEYQFFEGLNKLLVEKHGSSYKFDPISNQPHINLYDIDVPSINLQKIEDALTEIADETKSFSINLGKVSFFEHGTIYLEGGISDSLKELERKVVTKIVGFKGNCKTAGYWEPWRKYNETQIDNREKYGNPHVLDSYIPHITIGFLKKDTENLRKIAAELNETFNNQKIECSHLDLVVQDSEEKMVGSRRFRLRK